MVTATQTKALAGQYLRLVRLAPGIFVIGVLDTGVTILSQQRRALNLVWALDAAGPLAKARSIAVIGGGIAGVTAASALAKLLASRPHTQVALFERHSVLCPLQRGCDTRWVHPHAYDWPRDGAHNPSANLPVLNWRAGRASDVVAGMVREWEDLRRERSGVREIRPLRYLRINIGDRTVEWVGDPIPGHIPTSTTRKEQEQRRQANTSDVEAFDLILLAIGYGTERDSSRRVVSYWRNEIYGQPDMAGPIRRYLISGTGDGGLTDLLRIRLADFRHDRIIQQLARHQNTETELQRFEADYYRPRLSSAQAVTFFNECRRLIKRLGLARLLKGRLRKDTTADVLIARGSHVADAVAPQSSFINKFLAVVLFEAGGFTPCFGTLESQKNLETYNEIVVRHGPDSASHLIEVFADKDKATTLVRTMQRRLRAGERRSRTWYDERLWEQGWPSVRAGAHRAGAKGAYAPDATVAICSAFVSGLAPILTRRGGLHRVTLHRVVAFERSWLARRASRPEYHLQQVAHYQGARALAKEQNRKGGGVGRLFKIEDALIGLAVRTQRILVSRPADARSGATFRHRLQRDMSKLGRDWDPRKMDEEVGSLLACPILYRSNATRPGVVGVLFADSTKVGAFQDSEVRDVVKACSGLCEYLSELINRPLQEAQDTRAEAAVYTAKPSRADVRLLRSCRTIRAYDMEPPRVDQNYLNLEWSE